VTGDRRSAVRFVRMGVSGSDHPFVLVSETNR
jgi:hypothetical protein